MPLWNVLSWNTMAQSLPGWKSHHVNEQKSWKAWWKGTARFYTVWQKDSTVLRLGDWAKSRRAELWFLCNGFSKYPLGPSGNVWRGKLWERWPIVRRWRGESSEGEALESLSEVRNRERSAAAADGWQPGDAGISGAPMLAAGGTRAAVGYGSTACLAASSSMPYLTKLLLFIFCLVLLVESRKHRRRRWTSQPEVQKARYGLL